MSLPASPVAVPPSSSSSLLKGFVCFLLDMLEPLTPPSPSAPARSVRAINMIFLHRPRIGAYDCPRRATQIWIWWLAGRGSLTVSLPARGRRPTGERSALLAARPARPRPARVWAAHWSHIIAIHNRRGGRAARRAVWQLAAAGPDSTRWGGQQGLDWLGKEHFNTSPRQAPPTFLQAYLTDVFCPKGGFRLEEITGLGWQK